MFSENARFVAPSPAIEERIDAILGRLTLEEKVDLLGGDPQHGATKGNERVGIPMLKMADGPVGVHWWCDRSTAYPATIGAAASFDRELVRKFGAAVGRDARARGVHILLGPGVNLYRSPLCGRNFEYLGEDPYLAAELVTEYIRGLQSAGVSATVKHFAVNYQEFDRHNVSSDVDERTLHEVYLAAFRAAVERGGTGALMTAYNLVNGVHCSEHDELLRRILKTRWGFDGLVMSDWVSTYSAAGAANGGLDLEMPTALWLNREKLLPEVESGAVKEAVIDDKVRRMLRLAACFGWLDHEQQDSTIPLDDPRTAAIALDVARSSAVLLKNDGPLLPFDERAVNRVAVLGSHAHPAVICGGGSAYTPPNHVVSVLDGVRALLGDSAKVLHAIGFDPGREWRRFAESEFVTDDGEQGLTGHYFANRELSGEPVVTRVDPRMDFNWYGRSPAPGLGKLDVSVRWSGKLVVQTSGAHTLYVACPNGEFRLAIDGVVVLDFLGGKPHKSTEQVVVECAAGVAKTIALEYVKSEWSSIHVGWEPTADIERDREVALDRARNADAVILCVGFTSKTESEGFDRSFQLPEGVDAFVRDVAAANPRTAVVLFAGGNVDMDGFVDRVPALLHVWYPGQEGGTAIAELVFGRVTPSGKLPATFEKRLEDRSSSNSYHDTDGDKRVALSDGIFGGYRHFDKNGIEPRFPFGYGLSYTTFEYSNLGVSTDSLTESDRLRVSFDIRNSGSRRGAETALLFVRDIASRLPRPIKELKGFAKVLVEPGASTRVEIEIGRDELVYFDSEHHDWVYEPGEFEILIGASAADIRLRTTVRAV